MRLELREIIEVPGASVPFDCEVETERLAFPQVEAYLEGPRGTGLVVNEAGVLHLRGQLRSRMRCLCDRCGAPFELSKTTPLDAVIAAEESESDPEVFALEGDGIDLGRILADCFILDMDAKLLCRAGCKGLCQRCGKNLNLGPCGCGKQTDPRFAVLEQLLDK